MNARLEDPITQPERMVQALVTVMGALCVVLVGWLISVEVSDTRPSRSRSSTSTARG